MHNNKLVSNKKLISNVNVRSSMKQLKNMGSL